MIFQGIDEDGDGYLQLDELGKFVGGLKEDAPISSRTESSKSTTNFSQKAPCSLRRRNWEDSRSQQAHAMLTTRIGSRPERIGVVVNSLPKAKFHSLYQVHDLPRMNVLPPLKSMPQLPRVR